ncbi:SCO family protein [Rhodosalinus sediminis]|jgi:protein SCO1/2|uniref:SCO family protein n=1 Tax=Rhodosalinus sediminis TaxID=1940533 RepID=UPI002357F3BE|nr:SCO family protein [Rhodosalinus sediminis]
MRRLSAIVTAGMIAGAAGAGAAAADGWFSGLFGGGQEDAFAECRGGQVAGGAGQIGGPFTLVNAEGETVTDEDVITEPSILYFGYTFCPDVCPLDTARNAAAVDILEERGHSVTPVFISVDPERDTPEVVGDFAANLHPKMVGLTGSPEQVKAASDAYRTFYNVRDAGEDEFYLVDHSTFSYLVLPEHGFVDFFRRDESPEAMADRVQCFIEAG